MKTKQTVPGEGIHHFIAQNITGSRGRGRRAYIRESLILHRAQPWLARQQHLSKKFNNNAFDEADKIYGSAGELHQLLVQNVNLIGCWEVMQTANVIY